MGAVEVSIAKGDAAGLRDCLVEVGHGRGGLGHPGHRGGVERIVLGLHGPAFAGVAHAGKALGDEARDARLACGG